MRKVLVNNEKFRQFNALQSSSLISISIMKSLLIVLALTLTAPVFAESEPPVKMSVSGICHQKGKSSYYAQTKKFTAYKTIDECLKAGGRLPAK
jgi:hypothetical protein